MRSRGGGGIDVCGDELIADIAELAVLVGEKAELQAKVRAANAAHPASGT
jgi:hypothetical protein